MARPTAKPDKIDDRRMPFLEHLAELRTRLRRSVIAVAIGTAIAYIFQDPLFALMARPLSVAWQRAQSGGVHLQKLEIVYTNLTDSFMVMMKLALMAGIILATPAIFYQLWKFIAPGLYSREKKLAIPFVVSSVILFVGGAVFAYWYVLPASYKFFLSYSTDSMGHLQEVFGKQVNIQVTDAFALKPMITMDEYFGLTSSLLLVFGLVFELPLLLSVLAMIGIVSPRGLWRFNRYAILIFFILGAVVTPGDLVVGQVAMGLGLTVLYNLSIVAALFVGKKRRQRRAEEEAAEAAKEAEEAKAVAE